MCKFSMDKNGVYIIENKKKQQISRYMRLKELQCNIDESTYKAILEFQGLKGMHEIEVNRDQYLNKKNLLAYQRNGLDVTHDNVNLLLKYLRICENKIKTKNIHTNIGFAEYEEKTIYKLYETVGIESQYKGIYDIKPKGSEEIFVDMIKNEVLGKCELEFALICGLSAILLAYIGEEVGLDTLIIHLFGNSTTGKSTALKLAISTFGYPDVKKQGLYGTYNGTNNAILKSLSGLKGVPYALDEISMSNTSNFTKFIYGLANGTDKERLNKESELKKKETWLTTVLSNGEKSLIESSNKNEGVKVRVIEAANFVWTKNAENSEKINSIISKNYGHIGIKFAEYVMRIEKKSLIEEYNNTANEIFEKISESLNIDNMTKRRCNKFSILIQTVRLFENMMDIKMNINGITEMLIKIEEKSLRDRNFKDSVINYIKGYVSKYRNKFYYPDKTSNDITDILGKVYKKDGVTEVQMNKIAFEEMIKQGNYEDKNVILKELKEGGYLNCEKDRYTRTRLNQMGYKEEVYVIKLKKDS